MKRGIMLLLLTVVALAGCAGPMAMRDDPTRIPDSVLLRAEDFQGVAPTDGGPDPAVHPLPPKPCTGGGANGPEPTAERTINATFGVYHAYEYVAAYPDGAAQGVVDSLRDQLRQCAKPGGGQRYRVLAEDTAGVLFIREYNDGDAYGAYYVARAGDYVVAVLEVGTRFPNGDPTTASGLGHTAVIRAGGTPGSPLPKPTPTGPPEWSTSGADVTGVRRGPDARTLLVDVDLPAGHPDCARNPRTDQYTEENGLIYANVIFDSARSGVVGGCPTRAADVATLTAPEPVGDRVVVLNQQAWAPAGGGYRRCDADLGCHPPADHCDQTWILAAVKNLDAPRNSHRNVEVCDARGWLVLTLDLNSTACGAAPRPGCSAPPAVTRYFLKFADRWGLITQTTTGGCTAVQATEPAFPRELCENLPPTR